MTPPHATHRRLALVANTSFEQVAHVALPMPLSAELTDVLSGMVLTAVPDGGVTSMLAPGDVRLFAMEACARTQGGDDAKG
nr:hypothetical protein [Ardenticatena sp.]